VPSVVALAPASPLGGHRDVLAWLREHPALRQPLAKPRTQLETGLDALDELLAGGLPRGAITEITGMGSSGRTAFSLSILAHASRRGEVVAWLDPADSLDPLGVREAGVCLERFLWVRPEGDVLKQTLKAADLVLDAGGFAALVIDLAGVRPRARVLRPAWWVRLSRRAEAARTAVVTLAPRPVAGSAVNLRLACRRRGQALTVEVVRRRGAAPGGCVHTRLRPPVD